MKLSVSSRTRERKSDPKKNRRQGEIPGVIYGLNQANQNVTIKKEELDAILRTLGKGLLPTTVFELQEGSHKLKVLIKEIQYQPATYQVLHIDFLRLSDDEPVTVNVPIQILGLAECVGVKGGGFLRQVIRSLKVSCLPKDIPKEFTLDVRELDIAQSKTLGDIAIPERVKPLAKLTEVAAVIAKKV